MTFAIMVHGGAHAVPPEEAPAHRQGCLAALEAGWALLEHGGAALDAVEAAIRVLEDNPTFNAGFGSELNAAGKVEMDAALMDGTRLQAGAVGALQGARHPISVARLVYQSESVLLVAEGARAFAAERGAELCPPEAMISEKQRRKSERGSSDTVGCVALDAQGRLAAGTSTGGTNENLPGRIGDSPLVGCGLYADDALGACSMTGDGESITRVVLAKTAVDLLNGSRHPDEAAQAAMDVLDRRIGGKAGCILLDRQGRTGWAHNEPNISVAYRTSAMDAPRAFIHKEEERQNEESAPHVA